MKTPALIAATFLALPLAGCAVRLHGASPVPVYVETPPPPSRPPPAPPPARMMSYDEAVSRGFSDCRGRGYDCVLQNANLAGNRVWKVRFKVFGRGGKGHLHLDFDAYSRALLSVDEKVHGHGGHGHGHGHDEDDDD